MKLTTAIYAVAAALNGIVASQNQTYTNPVLWEDLADIDVFRVGDEYYYSASTMAFSPGAPILKSGDLVNWQYIGHSVPRLDFNEEAYSLESGKQAYVQGIWASSMRYRASDDTWYWIGCVDFNKTYIYTARRPTDEWTLAQTIDRCYYDCGLLFDDRDDIYVAYGNTNLSVARLNADLSERDVTPALFLGARRTLTGSLTTSPNSLHEHLRCDAPPSVARRSVFTSASPAPAEYRSSPLACKTLAAFVSASPPGRRPHARLRKYQITKPTDRVIPRTNTTHVEPLPPIQPQHQRTPSQPPSPPPAFSLSSAPPTPAAPPLVPALLASTKTFSTSLARTSAPSDPCLCLLVLMQQSHRRNDRN